MPSELSVEEIMARWRPGSADWGWEDEARELDKLPCPYCHAPWYQRRLEAAMQTANLVVTDPILLGDDGRVWDGHHRIVAANHLGIKELAVEYGKTPDPADPTGGEQ